MKFAFVINSLGSGGAERLIVDLCKVLPTMGIVPDVITLSDSQDAYSSDLKKLAIRHINLSRHTSLYSPYFVHALAQQLSSYDLVHVHLFPAQYWVALAGRLLPHLKIIVTEHNTFNERRKPRYQWIEHLVYSRYAKIVNISVEVLKATIEWLPEYKERCLLIPNGIDLDRFRRAPAMDRTSFGYQPTDKLITMVSRLTPQKDHPTVFRALQLLPEEYKLLLLGEGPDETELMRLCGEIGITHRVKFLGFRKDVPRILKSCDVSVLATHWEGFGLVAIESMAAGIPFICTDLPVLREVAADGGIFFERLNHEQLAGKIIQVCTEAQFRASILSRAEAVIERFSIKNMAEAHKVAYLEVLGALMF